MGIPVSILFLFNNEEWVTIVVPDDLNLDPDFREVLEGNRV